MENLERAEPRAREEKLVIQELPEEVLVYDLERHRAHSLNRTAALVWRSCDGKTSVAEMAELLNRELSLPADEQVVWMALARLQRAHLLQERVMAPGDGTHYSRRAMMRKLGLVGGLALLLPLVESIIAPDAAEAATVPPQCITNCCAGCRGSNNSCKCCVFSSGATTCVGDCGSCTSAGGTCNQFSNGLCP